jgi:hypothetical protein
MTTWRLQLNQQYYHFGDYSLKNVALDVGYWISDWSNYPKKAHKKTNIRLQKWICKDVVPIILDYLTAEFLVSFNYHEPQLNGDKCWKNIVIASLPLASLVNRQCDLNNFVIQNDCSFSISIQLNDGILLPFRPKINNYVFMTAESGPRSGLARK